MSSTNSNLEPTCALCQSTQAGRANPLKQCAKCKKAYYCSRECQKADWKSHKPLCRAADAGPCPPCIATDISKPCSKVNPFTALENGSWLRDRPEKDTFKLLVDTYRMRKADQFKFDETVVGVNVHIGSSRFAIKNDFFDFLSTVKANDEKQTQGQKPQLLPPWWNVDKAVQCVELAESDQFSNIYMQIEKTDIQKHYGDELMPMQLRMFGEEIDGTMPAGQSGGNIRRMMIAQKNGTGMPFMSHMNMGI